MSFSAIPPGSIVVGVDGSPQSQIAVTWAAEQAHLEDRRLTLVHGVGSGQVWWVDIATSSAEVNDLQQQAAMAAGRHLLKQTRRALLTRFPFLEIHVLLRPTDARQALLDLSETARMLVVGCRGRGPVASLMMGSVSGAVTSHAGCPIIVAHDHAEVATTAGITVGADSDELSPCAVEFAFHQASTRALPLTVTYCSLRADGPENTRQIPYDTPGYDDERRVLKEAVEGMVEKFPDVDVSLELSHGPLADLLIDAAHTSTMVVIGRRAEHFLWEHHLHRSQDRTIVRRASALVALVPEPRAPR